MKTHEEQLEIKHEFLSRYSKNYKAGTEVKVKTNPFEYPKKECDRIMELFSRQETLDENEKEELQILNYLFTQTDWAIFSFGNHYATRTK